MHVKVGDHLQVDRALGYTILFDDLTREAVLVPDADIPQLVAVLVHLGGIRSVRTEGNVSSA